MKWNLIIVVLFSGILLAEKCDYKYINENDKVLNLSFDVRDRFGCEYEYRNISKYKKKINLSFSLDYKNNRTLKLIEKGKVITFDIFTHAAPETDKIRDLIYMENKRILAISHGYFAYVDTLNGTVEVSSAFYEISVYKKYNNFLLKLDLKDTSFDGVEGFYYGEYVKYKYKQHSSFVQKIKSLKITNNLILISLETFLKPNYAKKYDSKFTFQDSSFDLETLKAILFDIGISKKTLTTYNNIAYYLQKANANKEAVFLLEEILKKYPKRTVAHYNLADAYWELDEKKKAVASYKTYIKQMKEKGKEKRIPKVVKERASFK